MEFPTHKLGPNNEYEKSQKFKKIYNDIQNKELYVEWLKLQHPFLSISSDDDWNDETIRVFVNKHFKELKERVKRNYKDIFEDDLQKQIRDSQKLKKKIEIEESKK